MLAQGQAVSLAQFFHSPVLRLQGRRTPLCLLGTFLVLCALSAGRAWGAGAVRKADAVTAEAAQGQPNGFGPLDPAPPTGLTADQIVAKFGERESAFAKARDQYTFRQDVLIQTINDDSGKPEGAYKQVTDVVFSDEGHRSENVVFAPANTIQSVIMTQNDFDDIEKRLPFVLTTQDLPQYDLTYLGRQKIDDVDTYVFDCKPKVLVKGKRYFQGKVWVDQQELEIVLINGKSVPDILKRGNEDLSPPYTTYYSEVDGSYWFPVYTHADGVLHFPAQNGAMANNVHIRYTVKYSDYKRFHAKSRIIYNGEDLQTAAPGKAAPPSSTGTTPATSDADKPQDPNAVPATDPNAPAINRGKPKG